MKQELESGITQNNTEETHKQLYSTTWTPDYSKNTQMITNEPIGETLIRVVGNPDTGYRASIGKTFISEPYQTVEEVIKKVKRKDWDIIMNVVSATIMMIEEYKEMRAQEYNVNNQNQ